MGGLKDRGAAIFNPNPSLKQGPTLSTFEQLSSGKLAQSDAPETKGELCCHLAVNPANPTKYLRSQGLALK